MQKIYQELEPVEIRETRELPRRKGVPHDHYEMTLYFIEKEDREDWGLVQTPTFLPAPVTQSPVVWNEVMSHSFALTKYVFWKGFKIILNP